jgi:lipopolysaccharide export LptBFGC system permease protein LptF
MKKIIQYIFAYICLISLWVIFVLIVLDIFEIINFRTTPSSILPGLILGYIYYKYKPMEFKKLIKLIKEKLYKKE